MTTGFDARDLFGSREVLDAGHVELFDAMIMDPRLKVVNTARVSFKKEVKTYDDREKKLVKFLYNHGHLSTYRHSYFSFRIKAPLFVFRQWWKYQVGSNWEESPESDHIGSPVIVPDTSWNEQSGRYVEFQPEFCIPNAIRKQSKDNKQGSSDEVLTTVKIFSDKQLGSFEETDAVNFYKASCIRSYEDYKVLVDAGAAKELARTLLPQSIYSECIWTCSIQTLLHFFNQRLKKDAQYEIRQYAEAIYSLVEPVMVDLMSEAE